MVLYIYQHISSFPVLSGLFVSSVFIIVDGCWHMSILFIFHLHVNSSVPRKEIFLCAFMTFSLPWLFSGAEIGRFVIMLRNSSSILRACAAFALLQVFEKHS